MSELRGNGMHDLFVLNKCRSRRASSYDRTGGNHDWMDVAPGATVEFARLEGAGIIRHIWCTVWVGDVEWQPEPQALRKLVLRAYWDGEQQPSIEAPLGDFFGMGFGVQRVYASAAFAMNPEDGRAMNCFFPMPFARGARFTLQNDCEHSCNLYFYIDYEQYDELPEMDAGYFHASWRRESNTNGWAPLEPGLLDREKANVPEEPDWLPRAWLRKNTDGRDNYLILDAEGRGKFVGCNLNIEVFERQANDWYGEGDDMFFIDGEPWPPSLHGTGTEDYFNTAFCPTQEYSSPYSGLTLYSGDKAGFKWGGKNSMYRLHVLDPIYFERSLRFSIEHGHANKLSNDYSSTAYWYQTEPHKPFEPLPGVEGRVARGDAQEGDTQ